MAKVVNELPEFNGNYPWDQWLDGQVWELKPGEDFHVDIDRFRDQCYGAAMRRGIKVKTRIIGGKIYIQAVRQTP